MSKSTKKALRRCPNCYTVLRPEEEDCWVCLEGPDMIVYVEDDVPQGTVVGHSENQRIRNAKLNKRNKVMSVFGVLLTGIAVSLGSAVIGGMIAILAVISFIVSFIETMSETCAGTALALLGLMLFALAKCVQLISFLLS